MPRIRRAFEHAHRVLLYAVTAPNLRSILSLVIRVDDPMLTSRVHIKIISRSAKRKQIEAIGASSCNADTTTLKDQDCDDSNNEGAVDEEIVSSSMKAKNHPSKKHKKRHHNIEL